MPHAVLSFAVNSSYLYCMSFYTEAFQPIVLKIHYIQYEAGVQLRFPKWVGHNHYTKKKIPVG